MVEDSGSRERVPLRSPIQGLIRGKFTLSFWTSTGDPHPTPSHLLIEGPTVPPNLFEHLHIIIWPIFPGCVEGAKRNWWQAMLSMTYWSLQRPIWKVFARCVLRWGCELMRIHKEDAPAHMITLRFGLPNSFCAESVGPIFAELFPFLSNNE